jgi:uncharacterized protein
MRIRLIALCLALAVTPGLAAVSGPRPIRIAVHPFNLTSFIVHDCVHIINDKAAQNLAKHGVPFLTAAEIFDNEVIERIDDREGYGELRFIALGRVELDVYRVAYTWRGENVIRIITAQKASKYERETYYREIFA